MGKYTELAQKTYSDLEKRKINKKYEKRRHERDIDIYMRDSIVSTKDAVARIKRYGRKKIM